MKGLWKFAILLILLASCAQQETAFPFRALPPEQTGINFNNEVVDHPDFNILDYLYFYNGGGVATGDLNNDGLPDIYFTSNLGEDKLYLNKGNFRFEDISDRFDAQHLKGWSTGVTLSDINHDGWLDIYVCKLGNYGPFRDHNKLFINQQGKKFVESAKNYGLDFSGFSTQVAFLDYDRDGDLDCYLLNHSVKSPEQFKPSAIRETKDSLAGDLFFERVGDKFVEVTASAGIYSSSVGFGLGIDVADVNGDGWLDIYVANDFHENDYLYLNQKDKSFAEVIAGASGHTSNFSMGCTIEDINNDLRPDIFSLDMKPDNEEVYKKSGGWESLEIYNFKRRYGYHHQSPRNALQINSAEQNGVPVFSERAALYGLEATDWSWSPLIYDFDNDGDKDLYITNGIVRRPNDMDFVKFHFNQNDQNRINQIQKMPRGDVPNCYFQNDLESGSFNKINFSQTTISTGAAVADLNLDGKLDIVVNNINAPAGILANTQNSKGHFLSIALRGDSTNFFGIGASVILYQGDNKQVKTIKSSSGFQSFSDPVAHFGFSENTVDFIQIIWPDGYVQVERIDEVDTQYRFKKRKDSPTPESSFSEPALQNIQNYRHVENDFNDQARNKWLLYNQSAFGPRLASINEKHIYVTGNSKTPSGLINTETNQFTPLPDRNIANDENCACLLSDNASATKQLFITKGGNEYPSGHSSLLDLVLSLNPAKPGLVDETFIPLAFNTSVCASHDFDRDGDEDVFVGIQSEPGKYGFALSSYLLVNSDTGFFKQDLPITGMIYDAVWSDLDGNGHADLVAAGHWMPLTILYNDGKQFEKFEIPNSSGLWFSVFVDDLDGDGRKDIIAGNFGTNHSLSASPKYPLQYYLNDFDQNGQQETLITYFKDGKEVPYPNQELFVSQLPHAKKKFLKNEDYAQAQISDLLKKELLDAAERRKIVELNSSYFLQKTKMDWEMNSLPLSLQIAPVLAIEKSAQQQYFFGGNLYSVDPNWGRQDAGQLTVFAYQNKQWKISAEAFRLPLVRGEIRDLLIQNNKLYIAINSDSLKVIDLSIK